MKQGEYHMAKKIHLRLFKIFVVIIFIFNLASCTNEPHLNWFTAQQIYQDHIDLYFKDDKRFKRTDFYAEYYIGKFNDYQILMIGNRKSHPLPSINTETFDDIAIHYSTSRYLQAWKDGNFYRLKELYEIGELSKEDIIKINEIYTEQKKKQSEKLINEK